MSVITVKRPLRKRTPDTTVNGEEEAAEVTRFRHQVITDATWIHHGDPEPSFPSNPCSREELAVALPICKRFIDLAVVTLLFPLWLPVMTLVGQRPCTVLEFERYAPEQRGRVNALPGLTGLWQVNGKNRTTFRQMIEMDIFYSRNISLSLDIKIILRTLPAILGQFFDSVQPL